MATPSVAGQGRSPFLSSEGAAAAHKTLGITVPEGPGKMYSADEMTDVRKTLGL